MTDDQLFGLANTLPLLGWLALAVAPFNPVLAVRFARVWGLVLALAYVAMVGSALLRASGPAPDLTSLGGLAHAFSDPHVMLIGWIHYLVFDLWVGTWEVEEAHRVGMPHALLLPCLGLTFVAGPAGLVLFVVLRRANPLASRLRNHDIT